MSDTRSFRERMAAREYPAMSDGISQFFEEALASPSPVRSQPFDSPLARLNHDRETLLTLGKSLPKFKEVFKHKYAFTCPHCEHLATAYGESDHYLVRCAGCTVTPMDFGSWLMITDLALFTEYLKSDHIAVSGGW